MAVDETPRDGDGRTETRDLLAAATVALREYTDRGWVRARPGVLDAVRGVVRPPEPVRGRHGAGEFFVSSAVLRARLGQAAARVSNARVEHVSFEVADGDLVGVTVETGAAYGAPLLPLADRLRSAIGAALADVLGAPERDGAAGPERSGPESDGAATFPDGDAAPIRPRIDIVLTDVF